MPSPAPPEAAAYWSDELVELHEESSRSYFLDVWNRRAIIDRLGPLDPAPRLLDVGCSSGYLLEDLAREIVDGRLLGIDYLYAALPTVRANVLTASPARADATNLPFADKSLDGIVSANALEHVPDDEGALAEFARVLRPGARAVVVVPAGPGLYDYYDRYLHHQRRYGRHELARKAAGVGFTVREDLYLGSLIYPAFFFVKKRNRLRHDRLRDQALAERVARDIKTTGDSRIGRLSVAVERRLLQLGVKLPFGVRELIVLEKWRDPIP